MTKDKTYDPFEGFKRISGMWEKQLNGLLYMMTDNNEFVRLMKVSTESHARYMELLRKNQELMAGIMNIPTKKDVAKVAKLSVQAEEKIDILEEQIWNVQDSLTALNKDHVEMFQELVSLVKQMKVEYHQIAQDIEDTRTLKAEIQSLKQEMSQLTDIKAELASIKNLMQKGKGKDKELVHAGSVASKS